MPRHYNGAFAMWGGGTQVKTLSLGHAVLYQPSKASEQTDLPAPTCLRLFA